MEKRIRIVFMGTPDFAVPSLEILIKEGYDVVGVITSPDKPAGRGRKIKCSAVKQFALSKGLNILQPINLKDPHFIANLTGLKPDLQIVVAFRMLPATVWKIPSLGTFNLHASLLPQYRGAAPINHAIINGEKETGVTTFLIDEKIDTGRILLQEKIKIENDETVGSLHDKLMEIGGELVLKTVKAIVKGNIKSISQSKMDINSDKIKNAPKIFKEDCKISWDKTCVEIDRFIRGLSPYPGAFSYMVSPTGKKYLFKVFKSKPIISSDIKSKESVYTDGKSFLKIKCSDGFVQIDEIQFEGKRRMTTNDFLRGFSLDSDWNIADAAK
jgi:methionyl-tRNA formyltransferase